MSLSLYLFSKANEEGSVYINGQLVPKLKVEMAII